jgi:hypothetical protein
MTDNISNLETSEEMITFNGINGDTGEYGLPPMTADQLAKFVQGEEDPEFLDELQAKSNIVANPFPVKEGVDPNDLAQSGWGVIFPFTNDPEATKKQAEIKAALQPLLDLRQSQAGKYFRIFEGKDAYRAGKDGKRGETKAEFLKRHDVAYGPVDPDKGVPYYLLIVGDPETIPYQFQFQLDVQFAVGRIHFDTVQEYANYAQSVVAAETGKVKLPRNLTFFGAESQGDPATQLSSKYLIEPLLAGLHNRAEFSDWQLTSFLKEQARKTQLEQILGGSQVPALLFTASHGMEFPIGNDRQLPHQGALLCSDWPGPGRHRGKIPQDFYFAGDDLKKDANLLGLITFHFACYGAGSPKMDEFSKQAFKERKAIAPYAFVGNLPKKLLSHGALAAIGHVERAWGYSFLGGKNSTQTAVFQSTLERLLKGQRVGYATEYFDIRYAELASEISTATEELEYDPSYMPPRELAGLWTAHNDARDYVVIGDPAAKLPLADKGETPQERPVIEIKPISSTTSASPGEAFTSPAGGEADLSADQEFGITETAEDLFGSLRTMAEKLGQTLTEELKNLTSLEVLTYTSEDMEGTKKLSLWQKGQINKATLRAMTHIKLDGDIVNVVPKAGEVDGMTQIDQELWQTHLKMVELAQLNRVEFIKAAGQIAGTILSALKS